MNFYERPETVKFNHLYGTTFAAFRGKRTKWNLREVIFPEGFVPEEGVDYEVTVHETRTGQFTYEGEEFRVSRAKLLAAATTADEFQQVVRQMREKPLNSLGSAFANLGL